MTVKPTIHWLTQNLSDVPKTNDWLSENEQETLRKLKVHKRQMDWRLGRWTAKHAFALHFEINHGPENFSRIEIRAAADGAPEAFFENQPAPASISISHSKGCGFCALSPGNLPLGCDVEAVEKRSDAFIADYFTAEERNWIYAAPVAKHPLYATLIWSAKESTMKALRQGLRLDTRSVEVQVDRIADTGWNSFTTVFKKNAQTFQGWWQVWDNFVLTAATQQPSNINRLVQKSAVQF